MQCNAKSKRSQQQCKRHAMKGKNKCAMHGGKSPGAPIKHGRKSKFVKAFGKTVETLLNDPDLLEMSTDVALLNVKEGEVLDQVQDGKPTELQWNDLLDLAERRSKLIARYYSTMEKVENAISTQYLTVVMKQIVDMVKEAAGQDVAARVMQNFSRFLENPGQLPLTQLTLIMTDEPPPTPSYDLSVLTDEELRQSRAINQKLMKQNPNNPNL